MLKCKKPVGFVGKFSRHPKGDIHGVHLQFGRQVSLQSATLDLVRGELNLFPWKRTLGQGESEKVNQ